MLNIKTVLLVLLTVLFISCRSLSPVTGQAERLVLAAAPDTLIPQWQSFAKVTGISYCAGTVSRPRMEFNALRVDLTVPELRIFTAGGGLGKSGARNSADRKFLSTRVSTFVRDHNLLAGINALPFDPVSGREGEPRANIGVVISDGVMVSPPYRHFDALVFYTDGTAAIEPQSALVSTRGINNAVGGFQRILENNAPVPQTLAVKDRHPRSAAGISSGGRFLYLLVIDGRRLGSVGATEAETAVMLRSLGAAEGINFDGGGSTSLALRYPDGRVRVVNTPIHRQIPGWERAVAGCLGLRVEQIQSND